MNCKFCNGELPEDVTLCPACGQKNAQEMAEDPIAEETVEEDMEIVEDGETETIDD